MAKAVIFDFDGVIANTEPLHFIAERYLFESQGSILPHHAFIETIGMTKKDVITHYIRNYGLSGSIDNLLDLHDARFQQLLTDEVECVPGIRNVLTLIRHNGVPYAVGSSNTREHIVTILQKLKLDAFFGDNIIDSTMVEKGKPAPDLFLKAADFLRIVPSKCVVIDDATNGIIAAAAAGMSSLFFTNTADAVETKNKCIIIHEMKDVTLSLIRSM